MQTIQEQIDNHGFFVKNNFICIPEEYHTETLRKTKSVNNLILLSDKEIEIINNELKDINLSYINLFFNISYDIFKKQIIEKIYNTLISWYESIELTNDDDIKQCRNAIIKTNEEYKKIILTRKAFTNKNIKNNEIRNVIKELMIMIDNSIIKRSPTYNEFIKNIDKLIIELSSGKRKILTIKDKLIKSSNIQKILSYINEKYLNIYIDIINEDKKKKIDDLRYFEKNFRQFKILVSKQLETFFYNYNIIIFDNLQNNWSMILKTNYFSFDINDNIILGDNIYGKILIKIISPFIIYNKDLKKLN